MARRLPSGILHPASPGGTPRAADDVQVAETRVDRSVPHISEELGGTPGSAAPRRARGRKRVVKVTRTVRRKVKVKGKAGRAKLRRR